MSESGKVWDGQREWTYADLAENEQHLRYLIDDHSPDTNSGKTFCPVCDRRAPCDITTLAATALAALTAAQELQAARARIAELETVLAPFARVYWQRHPGRDARPIMTVWDEQQHEFVLTAGDFHRASAALAAEPAAGAEDGAGEVISCTRCGDPITDGYMIGDGDGSGQRFAHPECYRQYPGAYKFRDTDAPPA